MQGIRPSVAVLLAAFNGMEFIEEQLQTILQQQDVDVTVFISVDLSDDITYQWCLNFAEAHSSIKVLSYGERFGGAAPNFFRLVKDVDFSAFDYVAFSDQDDVWFVDKLSYGIKQMDSVDAQAYSANVIAFWKDGRKKLIDKSQKQRKLDYLFEAAGPGCTYIFTNKAAILIKKYLNSFPELNDFILHDWLSYAILRNNKYRWFIDPVPKMYYRQHDGNQLGANASFETIIYRMNYILSGQVFESIKLLINTFDITSVQISSRIGVLRLAFKVRQLRRGRIDQALAFIALFFYAIKGPKG